MKKLEEEKAEAADVPPQSQPTPPLSVGDHLQPKGLNFTTPSARRTRSVQMTPSTPATPSQYSERLSDVESLSSENTSVTPDMQKLNIGKRRGRPRKELVQPNMDDFPYDASKEEQQRYIRKKNTEFWRYKKLAGSDAATYRQAELDRVNTYNKNKKKQKEPDDETSQDTDSDRQKKLSRER